MPSATPDTLGDVLAQLIQSAADQAAAQPDRLNQILDDAKTQAGQMAETAQEMPAELLQKLKQAVDPPDWWSLLVFVLVKVSELDPHLKVGTMQPAGWSRTITVTYTLDTGQSATVGLALTDPGLMHGLTLDADAPLTVGPLGAGPLTVSITTYGKVQWRIPFTGPLAAPTQTGTVDVSIGWDPKISVGDAVASLSLGPARAAVHLSSSPAPGDTLWRVSLSLGAPPGPPGAEAKVDLGQALGALCEIVHIDALDEKYSPALVLAPGASPQFSLGNS